jgi:Arc/MetJ-type ribon-helix-helix transcriptional regulator
MTDTLLPRDLEELVKRKVEAGEYESASDMAALCCARCARWLP